MSLHVRSQYGELLNSLNINLVKPCKRREQSGFLTLAGTYCSSALSDTVTWMESTPEWTAQDMEGLTERKRKFVQKYGIYVELQMLENVLWCREEVHSLVDTLELEKW